MIDNLDLALEASGYGKVHVVHKARLLSDNGSSYVFGNLVEWLQDKGMKHSCGAPFHPQTQGKIERCGRRRTHATENMGSFEPRLSRSSAL